MTHFDIIMKLIGPVTPAGDSSIDPERFENLKTLADVTVQLVDKLNDVAKYKFSHEGTVKKAGEYADVNMKVLSDYFE